ncbi:DUF4105 domain-containing protein [Aurantibacter sp.]|uniref:lipoprotein N-acyltransferase Lnb domain-containing protein n=1 Tax=Aurantibacter sp. TaxID=2807103 RepID=UPI0035C78CF9
MNLKRLPFLVSILFFTFSFGQSTLLEQAKISILTIEQGKNISDAFGHSGIRIKNGKEDVVYDYGRYPFNDPNFILNFCKGKLDYSIGKESYRDFMYRYKYFNRSVKEQVLDLTFEEKQTYYNYILNNYKPQNRVYSYDFFFDNCATKIHEVTNTVLNNSIDFKTPKSYSPKTFRTLIQDELNKNSWESFGIDLALGSKIDQLATEKDHMFLPKNVYTFFKVATINNKTLVKSNKTIFKAKPINNNSFITLLWSPLVICILLALFIIYKTYKDFKQSTRSRFLDVIIFTITGLIGVLLLLLWFATDHNMTAHNYNILWAFPLNLLFIKAVINKTPSILVSKYFMFLILMLVLMCTHWISEVQRFASTILPLIIALLIRYIYVFWFVKSQNK